MDDALENILLLLEKLGVDVENARYSNDNVMISCPFASVSHADGIDNKPSFGIKISDSGVLWNCFTGGCEHKGSSLLKLVEDLNDEGIINGGVEEAMKLNNSISIEFPEYEEQIRRKKKKHKKVFIRRKNFLPKEFIEYSAKRGVREDTLKIVKATFVNGKAYFPLYSLGSDLIGVIEHSIDRKSKYKYINKGFNKDENIYLEWLIRRDSAGIIVEGVFDAILVLQHLIDMNLYGNYSVIGMIGTQIPEGQLKKIVDYFDRIVLMGDNDIAGIAMENTIYKKLKNVLPLIYKVEYKENDPGDIKDIHKFEKYLNNISLYKQ